MRKMLRISRKTSDKNKQCYNYFILVLLFMRVASNRCNPTTMLPLFILLYPSHKKTVAAVYSTPLTKLKISTVGNACLISGISQLYH